MILLFFKILDFLALSTGVIGSFGYLSQAYKILRHKSVNGVSIYAYFLFLSTIIIWLIYGITYNDSTIIMCNAILIISCITVIILYFVYRHHKHYCDNCNKLFMNGEEYHKIKLKSQHHHKLKK